jgi:hypothetical protein
LKSGELAENKGREDLRSLREERKSVEVPGKMGVEEEKWDGKRGTEGEWRAM